MSDPGFLFTLGNKRSGTTLLVELLNMHPKVFVSHESDIIWLLFQLTEGAAFTSYPWDGPVGMEATLKACRNLLEDKSLNPSQPGVIRKLFLDVERFLMINGSLVQQPHSNKSPAWVGDKKPVQHADPKIHNFILREFPDARFIHIVRHPKPVVSSMMAAGKSWGPVPYWRESPETILERWAIHEEWVISAIEKCPERVFSLRFEDLTIKPVETMTAVLQFLDLDIPSATAESINQHVVPVDTSKYSAFKLPFSSKADEIMRRYDYNR